MHDRRADRQLGEVADDALGFAAGALAAARLGCALGVELALGEHAQSGFDDAEAVFQRRHRDRVAGAVIGGEGGPVGDRIRLEVERAELLDQRLAAAGGVGGDQHATRVARQQAAQGGAAGLVLTGDRRGRCGRIAQRQCFVKARMALPQTSIRRTPLSFWRRASGARKSSSGGSSGRSMSWRRCS
jgi:hypothetical protein